MSKPTPANLTPAEMQAILRLLSARRAAHVARLSPITRLRGGLS